MVNTMKKAFVLIGFLLLFGVLAGKSSFAVPPPMDCTICHEDYATLLPAHNTHLNAVYGPNNSFLYW